MIDILNNSLPLCSGAHPTSNEPNSKSLSRILAEEAYWFMLFILLATHTAGSAGSAGR